MEMECPIKLEGKNGRWHSFRVEAVDQFDNESVNEIVRFLPLIYHPVGIRFPAVHRDIVG
jgi:hypothetical protein